MGMWRNAYAPGSEPDAFGYESSNLSIPTKFMSRTKKMIIVKVPLIILTVVLWWLTYHK